MPAFDNVVLHSPRLVLRPFTAADAPALLAIFSDPRVMRYWSTPPWTGLEQAHAMIERDQRAMPAGEHLRLGLEHRADGRLIGQCTLFALNAGCRRAEIGYALASSAWGQGLMHEALTALLNQGFGPMNLNRIEADIDPRNAASEQSLLRLGFTKEGHLRERWIVDGEVSDTGLYGLLRREWAARPSGLVTPMP